jgi:hypothetical protein
MNLRNILSVYQVAFGIVGIGMLAFLVLPQILSASASITSDTQGNFLFALGVYAFALVFYVLAILAGVLLWRKHRAGKTLSIVLEIIQIPVFIVAGIQYYFSLGLSLNVYMALINANAVFRLQFFPGPQASFSIGESTGFLLGLNVSAVLLLILFLRLKDDSTVLQ